MSADDGQPPLTDDLLVLDALHEQVAAYRAELYQRLGQQKEMVQVLLKNWLSAYEGVTANVNDKQAQITTLLHSAQQDRAVQRQDAQAARKTGAIAQRLAHCALGLAGAVGLALVGLVVYLRRHEQRGHDE